METSRYKDKMELNSEHQIHLDINKEVWSRTKMIQEMCLEQLEIIKWLHLIALRQLYQIKTNSIIKDRMLSCHLLHSEVRESMRSKELDWTISELHQIGMELTWHPSLVQLPPLLWLDTMESTTWVLTNIKCSLCNRRD